MAFQDADSKEIDQVMEEASRAFEVYRKLPLKRRADFLRAIAVEIEGLGEPLIQLAMQETNLAEGRLKGERGRTIFQLNSYADACERGNWLDIRIDTAIPSKTPPKPDLRKMLVPIGPVVVFGASNFPFAFSTAGGDTAAAFAAGCPVVVKAHPAHAGTSTLVAGAIANAISTCGLPVGLFAHVHGNGFEVGTALVQSRYTKAVAFTGSFGGGKALFDIANQRKEPIPVFAEMGSINPVFLLPGKLNQAATDTAKLYAGSITLGTGQFCTNPGLLVGIDGAGLDNFMESLAAEIRKIPPTPMLHPGIAKTFNEKRTIALSQAAVSQLATSDTSAGQHEGIPTVAWVMAETFLANPLLHQEVFGPYSLVIRCTDSSQVVEVARRLEGQLTCTLMATEQDVRENGELVDAIQQICGRFILNNPPTGVEVCLSMQHGGPYPATTDSRYTSVGADGLKRFARPVSWQNWPDSLLPDELKNSNPLQIWRTVNDQPTNQPIV